MARARQGGVTRVGAAPAPLQNNRDLMRGRGRGRRGRGRGNCRQDNVEQHQVGFNGDLK